MNSILTVTTPASSYDLTALATVKTELDIVGSTENAKLRTWITQASQIASRYCRRVFAQETLTETFRPEHSHYYGSYYAGGGYGAAGSGQHRDRELLLARRPIASITSVTVDDVVLDAAEYEFDAAAGMLYRLSTSGYRCGWYFCKSIVVVYVAGYELLATLPQDIERAVIMMVRDMRADQARDPSLIEKETVGVSRYRWWSSGDAKTTLPLEISGLLDPYRNYYV